MTDEDQKQINACVLAWWNEWAEAITKPEDPEIIEPLLKEGIKKDSHLMFLYRGFYYGVLKGIEVMTNGTIKQSEKKTIRVYDGEEVAEVVEDAATWNNIKKYGDYESDFAGGELYRTAENDRLYFMDLDNIPKKQQRFCDI